MSGLSFGSKKQNLLILEDDERFREILFLEFSEKGYHVMSVGTLEGLRELDPNWVHLAIVDLRLRGDSGLQAVEWLHHHAPRCRTVVMTGYASIPTAVQAIRMGAINYLSKPVSVEGLEKALLEDGFSTISSPALRFLRRGESLAAHERSYIDFVLLQCGGNITQAAKWLGLHRQSLQRKLKKYS